MNDIPDRVTMLAEAVNDEIFRIAHDEVHVLGHTERKAAIARAIMAAEKRGEEREREACLAAIRSLHADAWGITEEQSALDDAIAALERRGAVVAAIRNRGAEQ